MTEKNPLSRSRFSTNYNISRAKEIGSSVLEIGKERWIAKEESIKFLCGIV